MSEGDRERIQGEPPYSLVIGNAAAATIMVGDNRLDLDAIATGNVARFELDPTQPHDRDTASMESDDRD